MTTPALQPYALADEAVTVTLDGSGNGTASWTPGSPARGGGTGTGRNSGLSVAVTGVAVSVAPLAGHAAPVLQARCDVYLSYGILVTDANSFQGTTVTGSTGDTDTVTATIRPGDWITARWTSGDPGAIATMRILGTLTPPGVSS